MRATIIAVFIWLIIGAYGANLSDIVNMLSFPLDWTPLVIPYQTSSTCTANINQTSWIVGGKAIGVTNDISNMAQKIQFTKKNLTRQISDEVMEVPGSFPGQYLVADGIFCKTSSALYGTFNDSVKQFCFLGANDGTSNSPQCGCCSVEGSSKSRIRCKDLSISSQCPPLFDSCIINDKVNNRGMQIGGSSGVHSLKNILCFDINNETFTKQVDTYEALTAESANNDPLCEYGSLALPAFDMGCDMMRNDSQRSIIVVGGKAMNSTGSTFLNSIQVCKNDHTHCQVLQNLKLPVSLSGMRVVGLTDCIFLAIGGINSDGETNGQIYVGDICDQQWLHTEAMPALLSEFSIVTGIDSLCLYGGIVDNELQNIAYCTSFHPDAKSGGGNNSSTTSTHFPSTTFINSSSTEIQTTFINSSSTKIQTTSTNSPSRQTQKKAKSSAVLIGVVVAIIVSAILIMVGLWYYCKRNKTGGSGWNDFLVKSRSYLSSKTVTTTQSAEKTMTDIAVTKSESKPTTNNTLKIVVDEKKTTQQIQLSE